ncbi:MAG: VTT domain-containing protein [Rhodothermales bacterium]
MRLLWIFLGLAVLFLIPFLIWGGQIEAMFSQDGTVAWLRGYGAWAWMAGIVLLMSDIVLPVPGTVVMSALGFVYGPVAGGLLAALGAFLGGALGYGLCRLLGRKAALRLLGEADLEKGERLFSHIGGWLVALSRWLPLFPEVIACMAGLIRMPAGLFHFALACGVLPLGFAFAYIGHAGVAHPWLAIGLSAFIPPILWLAVRPIVRRMIGESP